MSTPYPRSRIVAWTFFDFANTAFSVIIVTVIFSRYFTTHVAGGRHVLWGLSVSLSMIIAALLSPPLGAAADYSRYKKRFLIMFTAVSVVCTALLYFVVDGMIFWGMLLFILANIGFEGGLVFYDAFLPSIATPKTYGRVSGYGFAMGYLGALAVLVIVRFFLPDSADPSYLWHVRLSFVIAAVFFLVFSLPMFLFVPEPGGRTEARISYVRRGMAQAALTFRSLFVRREYPSVARFLIAFFIYNDGILTVIAFAAIFAANILQMSDQAIILFFTVVQTSAIVGSVVFGVITDSAGPKKTIAITLVIWIAICIGAYFVTSVATFYIIAFAAGIAIGSSQSASRSMMALLTPKEREGEFFGFYDGLCGKASAVVGPLIYGFVADLSDERTAALAIGLFFATGLFLLRKVEEPSTVRIGTASGNDQ